MFRVVFAVVTFGMVALYLTLIFWIEPQLSQSSGGLALFDLRPSGYSLAQVTQYFRALDHEGRDIYLSLWYPVDMVFLLFLSAFFTLSIRVLFHAHSGFWRLISILLPLAYGLSDALENVLVSSMFKYGVGRVQDWVVALASFMTQLKFVIFATLVVLLITGLVRWFLRRRRGA